MKTFIICDSRNDFQNDIKTSMMLDSYPLTVKGALSFSEACNLATKYPDATIVLSEIALKDADITLLPRPAYGYAVTPSGTQYLTSLGVTSIGMYRTSSELLDALSNNTFKASAPAPQKKTQPTQSKQTSNNLSSYPPKQTANTSKRTSEANASRSEQNHRSTRERPANNRLQKTVQSTVQASGKPVQQTTKSVSGTTKTSAPPAQPVPTTPSAQPAQPAQPAQQTSNTNFTPEMLAAMMKSPEMQAMMMQMAQGMNAQNQAPSQQAAPDVEEYDAAEYDFDVSNESIDVIETDEPEESYEEDEEPQAPVSIGEKMRSRKRKREAQIIDENIDEDLLARAVAEAKTKVITIYAAKGGVGKTSIATELAVCLALTTNGRRRFRVCLVDYNIDFGDVATTLEFKDDGTNMSYWAAEIREMIERGVNPDEIEFTKTEMDSQYLQIMEDAGLYALCSPVTHEDSMLIKPAELEIMLRNIIKNGEFDFVICDTGNNTRDSSIIALDHSDYVLLVATQDVTTANCNASVLRTLEDSGFDTNKVRLVINNAMSSRETGVSVQEVEEAFPYPCVCRIKRTSDIIKANNLSRPLVYKPNHEYTKQIQRIIRFVTQGEIPEEPKKKGFFSFIRK